MDQERRAGHHAITRDAVHELFMSGHADSHGRIDGMTEQQYAAALDHAQEEQDSILGNTWHPAHLDPTAQRQHATADPSMDGAHNLAAARDYVVDELALAHVSEDNHREELRHLGAATHALEDSYSDAHMFRGDAVYGGDPTAPVESLNAFEPAEVLMHPSDPTEGTHDPRFDHVPVDAHGHVVRDSDRAAVEATAHMLERYEDERHHSLTGAVGTFHEAIAPYFQATPAGVRVNDDYDDPAWQQERDRRLHIQETRFNPIEPDESTSHVG